MSPWEAAYARFETPEEEIRKFERRLRELGVHEWPKSGPTVELFCGRGNGLHALRRLGFTSIAGMDLSPALLERYLGEDPLIAADCRRLPLASASCGLAIVQGGLHHLPDLPADLDRTLAEVHRVLRPGARLVVIEPWLTPFLRIVHAVAQRSIVRRLWGKLDALATMIEHERETYERWLGAPGFIEGAMQRWFEVERRSARWGKLMFVGRRRENGD
ncbi:MAG: class I SAM-dependent methyltransferase [Gemmatimonadota bacterium]|nr:class I SAM-dependent methyltransferase [Gemmatimonadota bacterium]